MSTYALPILNEKPPQITDAGFFADIRFDPNDATPDYIGLHVTNGAATSDTKWKIYKFTYSGGSATRIQLAYGAWDNRTTLF